MDFNTNLAARAYQSPGTAPKAEKGSEGSGLATAAGEFAEVLRLGEDMATQAVTGQVDPHALVEALTQTELAVETAIAVRDKVVEAYQEILRMPV